MDLVTELKDLRETRGISQAAVAAAIGVDQSAVSHWESGKAAPGGSARILLKQFVEEARKLPRVSVKGNAA